MRFLTAIWVLLISSQFVNAVNYRVSPGGNDGSDGLDSATARISVDNGDVLGIGKNPCSVFDLHTRGNSGVV